MRNVKKLLPALLALPLISFAASAPISDWGFEPNGDVRAVVGEQTVFVSPENEADYFQTLMAARLGWGVEVSDNGVVVDVATVPVDQQSLLATCTTASCVFSGVTRVSYGCLLDEMYSLVVASGGSSTTWPDKNGNSGVAAFSIPNVGSFSINVLFEEPAQKLTGTVALKPAAVPYAMLWGYVDTQLKNCPK